MSFFDGAGSALLGGALSGISNLFGASSQNKNVDKQINAAKEEAEKTRGWQTSERKAQQEWNYNMWLANNEYNTPSALMQRYREAGLNTDLMYSGGNVQSPGTPAVGGHTPSGPVADTSGYNRYRPLGDVVSRALNDAATAALTAKTSTETEGQKHTNDILASDAAFRNAYNQGILSTQDSEIAVNNSTVKLNDQQINESRSRISKINAEISKISQEINLLISQAADVDSQVWERHVRVALDSAIQHGYLKIAGEQLKLDQRRVKMAYEELMSKLPLMASQKEQMNALASLYNDLGFKANAEEERIRFDLSQAQNWDDFERGLNAILNVASTAASFIPFTNPQRDVKSGKPKSKVEYNTPNRQMSTTYYDYYD